MKACIAPEKEPAMSQSMISFWVGLAVVLMIALVLAQRYRDEHPDEGWVRWLDAHHMSWMHRRH
jgi:hypothetical protein